MAIPKREIEKIEKYYADTERLFHLGEVDAAAVAARKVIEGIMFITSKNEGLSESTITRPSPLLKIDTIARVFKKNALNYLFIHEILQLSNQAAHFEVDDGKTIIENRRFDLESLNDLKKLKADFENYAANSNKKTSADFRLLPSTDTSDLPFAIKNLYIKNFQCIKEINIHQMPIDSQFIVFTGENGDGKTSILQALAIGLYGNIDEQSQYIFNNNPRTKIEVGYKNNGKESIYNSFGGFGEITRLPYLVAYGASRLQLQSPESMEDRKTRRSPVYNLFRSDGVLQNIEYWFKECKLNNEEKKLQNVLQLLTQLMPNVSKISVEKKKELFKRNGSFEVAYTEKGVEVPVEHLSAGHKNILAMVGDMLMRLFEAQPEVVNPNDLKGIVLIDEIEAHLHPIWQKEFPKILSSAFPKVQFIVTTHSVITFLGMPKNSVFYNVTRDKDKGTQVNRINIDIENLLPNQILTSPIFGMNNILTSQNQTPDAVRTEDTFQQVIQRDDVRKQIKKLSENFKFEPVSIDK